MIGSYIIYEEQLARLLRVSQDAFIEYALSFTRDRGLSAPLKHSFVPVNWYASYSAVQTFLNSKASGFTEDNPQPAFTELLQRFRYDPRCLLTTEETAAALRISNTAVADQALDGTLPAFLLPGDTLRFPAMSIMKLVNPPEKVTAQEAALLTGMTLFEVGKARLQGVLTSTRLGERITSESILSYLEGKVATFTTPLQWWQQRWMYHEAPYALKQVGIMCRLKPDVVQSILEAEQAPCIFNPRGELLIPAYVMRSIKYHHGRLDLDTIERILGIYPSWSNSSVLCKNSAYGHATTCPSLACMKEYIVRNRAHPSVDPEAWLAAAIDGGATPHLATDVARLTAGLTAHSMEEMIASGELPAIKVPGGTRPYSLLRAPVSRFVEQLHKY